MSKKWQCEICKEVFSSKKELVKDLKGHFEWAQQDAEEAVGLLSSLGIKNPYEQ